MKVIRKSRTAETAPTSAPKSNNVLKAIRQSSVGKMLVGASIFVAASAGKAKADPVPMPPDTATTTVYTPPALRFHEAQAMFTDQVATQQKAPREMFVDSTQKAAWLVGIFTHVELGAIAQTMENDGVTSRTFGAHLGVDGALVHTTTEDGDPSAWFPFRVDLVNPHSFKLSTALVSYGELKVREDRDPRKFHPVREEVKFIEFVIDRNFSNTQDFAQYLNWVSLKLGTMSRTAGTQSFSATLGGDLGQSTWHHVEGIHDEFGSNFRAAANASVHYRKAFDPKTVFEVTLGVEAQTEAGQLKKDNDESYGYQKRSLTLSSEVRLTHEMPSTAHKNRVFIGVKASGYVPLINTITLPGPDRDLSRTGEQFNLGVFIDF